MNINTILRLTAPLSFITTEDFCKINNNRFIRVHPHFPSDLTKSLSNCFNNTNNFHRLY